MLLLSRVCAEFSDRKGRVIFSVGPRQLLSFLEAPEEIRQDPLFDLLLKDGSMEAVQSVLHRKALEDDPVKGMTAEGKKANAAADTETDISGPDFAVAGVAIGPAAITAVPADSLGAQTADPVGADAAAAAAPKARAGRKAAAAK